MSWSQFYALYLRIFYGSTVARQRKLKSDILLNKKELLQTSAQDQFAKWAKLRRSVDKGLADLEKLSKSGAPSIRTLSAGPVASRMHVSPPLSAFPAFSRKTGPRTPVRCPRAMPTPVSMACPAVSRITYRPWSELD